MRRARCKRDCLRSGENESVAGVAFASGRVGEQEDGRMGELGGESKGSKKLHLQAFYVAYYSSTRTGKPFHPEMFFDHQPQPEVPFRI